MSEGGILAPARGGVHTGERHESAVRHVTGNAAYIDDLPEARGLLHVALGLSPKACGRIVTLDLDRVRAAEGVVQVITAADIPGENDISPAHLHDEPVFPAERVAFHGQPLFAVAAVSRDLARRAARLAVIEIAEETPVTTIAQARAAGVLVTKPLTLRRGETAPALAAAPHRITGTVAMGGQDHFYLEGQIALAIPGEGDEMQVLSSTQHPSETQLMVAQVLGVPRHAVTVEVRRMGGGFGGKETQANFFACVAAVLARLTGRPVKFRPDRDEDMIATGKRHDMIVDYQIGFDGDGRFQAVEACFAARCGNSADLSGPVTDRTLFHADNAYFYETVQLRSEPLKTNTVSNTAFRGFGGPQGMVLAERLIDEVAFALGADPLDIRKRNLYGLAERNITPYHQTVEDNVLHRLIDTLEARAEYRQRRQAIMAHNQGRPVIRRGLALTPVKFGISFTATHFNQAGALVHVYTDGSVQINHGGTEMGQGLHTKIIQVVAETFGIDAALVRVTATNTSKVPNTSATAASSGSDMNGMAARSAALTIRDRLAAFAAGHRPGEAGADGVVFAGNRVRVGTSEVSFAELAQAAYAARVSLSANGFYATPKIHWDRETGRGRPFYYFAYGAACAEVAVDSLTGEYRVLRVDILHDVGNSLNPAIDKGQIEGGFIQGMGWLTTEELWWDAQGRLRTHAPSTYKIPTCGDRPRVFTVDLLDHAANPEETIFRSKAVGEPPFMLGLSVLHALSDAVASVADHRICPRLDAPATPERVLMTIERLKAEAAAG